MGKSELFDKVVSSFSKPFTRSELNEALKSAGFDGTDYYIQSLIYDRTKRGMIISVGKGIYANTNQETDVPVLLKKKSTTSGQAKRPSVDYSFMINKKDTNENDITSLSKKRDNGRFLKLKETCGFDCAKDNGIDKNLDYLVLLNERNSKKVEKMILEDDGYIQFTKMVYTHYKNSSFFRKFPRYNRDAIFSLIRIIDIENSTNVWRYNREAINKMVEHILNKNNDFWGRLKKGDPKLVDDLKNVSKTDVGEPKSLASKVCKYFAQHILRNNDLFYINDKFVRKVLPFYLKYYCDDKETTFTFVENASYEELYRLLSKLHAEIRNRGEKLDKSCLDHIMWYCYKESGNKEKELDNQ